MLKEKEKQDILEALDSVFLEVHQCPLSYNRDFTRDCKKERCPWWVDGKCAVVSIAQSLRIIAGKGV